jgi:thiol:disulfide interchange protein/DsbC/DsbD-like thiol-disulfide interchange protein
MLVVTSAVATSTGSVAQAAAGGSQHVAATLIGETRNVVAGRPLHLALRHQIQAGWHTYWSNPGESGLPTTIDWSLPRDFKAGPIMWPTPERFVVGPVVGYGYQDEVFLPVTIEVPAGLQTGSEISLSAHAGWLACSDICIPEEVELSISLAVGTVLAPDPKWADAFAATRARIPTSNPFSTTATRSGDELRLRIAAGDATRLQDVTFFTADQNIIDDGAPQSVAASSEGLVLTLRRDTSHPPPSVLNGVVAFRDQAGGVSGAISISAPIGSAAPDSYSGLGLIAALLLAVAGGIILNLMPCVLPVLSIKVLSLVQHSHSAPRHMRLQGIAYAAGVLTSFAIIGGALIGLRAAGAEIGWGFQLQSPIFVTLMIYLLFAVGLNLSGVFTVGSRMTGVGSDLALREGYTGSFFAGALATLVATPCTAPFMAAAIGYAVTQPWYVSVAILEAIGLGLALPYLLIAFSPRVRSFLPKPGIWMLWLKEFLAFPVYGTAVWLVYVLSQQAGASAATAALAGLVLIAFAAWLYDAAGLNEGHWRRLGVGLSTIAVAGAFALASLVDAGDPSNGSASAAGENLHWQAFSQAKFDALRADGRPIFIDFTAAWCITCKVNERITLADPAVVKAFADGGVVALRADWTRQDTSITRLLEANGRAGVPLYLFYPKPTAAGERRPPIILPQLLTAASILREIQSD